ncbi:MAG: DUF2569 family protein [Bacteroidales bacterium]
MILSLQHNSPKVNQTGHNFKGLSFIYIQVFSFIFLSSVAQKNSVVRSENPTWITSIMPDYTYKQPENATAGSFCLLINEQDNIVTEETYIQFAIKLLNNDGLQEFSDIQITFDPTYQKLHLNSLKIIRDGHVKEILVEQPYKLIQREENLERHIYDGRISAVFNLKDTRIGDIIEYSYTLEGFNPLYRPHYSNYLTFGYSVPVARIYKQIVAPVDNDLRFVFLNGCPPFDSIRSARLIHYSWDLRNVPQKLTDINIPEWYNPYPEVIISDFLSWEEVANWSSNLYKLNPSETAEINLMTIALFGKKLHGDSSIIKIIRFVQDEIRYLGFENGLNNMKPELPVHVLKQRYGDCKAKSLLLAEMLKTYGLDAAPMLVHTVNGYRLNQVLPSPDFFNHCVVHLNHRGMSFNIDPTLSFQGGDLLHLYFPNYYKGLVLKPGEKYLTDIPTPAYTSVESVETYTLNSIGKGGKFEVATTYTGCDADNERYYLANNDLNSIQQNYLNFYSNLFPTIKNSSDITYTDARDIVNILTVKESYTIDSLWEKLKDTKTGISFSVYPLSLKNYLVVDKSPNRTMPYAVNYPLDYYHKTILVLPEEWNINEDEVNLSSDAFEYNYNVHYNHEVATITHHYKTLKPFISAEDVNKWVVDHDKIHENLWYSLTYNPSLANKENKLSLIPILISLVVIALTIYLGIRLINIVTATSKDPDQKPLEIGGFLIFLAFGLVISPILLIKNFYFPPTHFNGSIYERMLLNPASNKEFLTGVLLFLELIYNSALIVFSVIITILFFRRRDIFPKTMIWYQGITLVFFIIDNLMANQISPEVFHGSGGQSNITGIYRSILSAVIWIPYLLTSNRVKQTFTIPGRSKPDMGKLKEGEKNPQLID